MSFTLATLLLGLAAAASASSASSTSAASSSSLSEHYNSPYTYVTYYSNNQEVVRTYETCSAPPSSIEICLSSIFVSIEGELTKIAASLAAHEVSIKGQMHHEHTLLYSEISWVKQVESIAASVKEAVYVNYEAQYGQLHDLALEKQQIDYAYEVLIQQLDLIEAEVKDVQDQRVAIYDKFQSVRVAKWSLYSAISAIVYEKVVVQEEEAEIEEVVANLNAQLQNLAAKMNQLNKRQNWLNNWEQKLYVDIEQFEKNINQFKAVEVDLVKRQTSLYQEQDRLLYEVQNVEVAIGKLRVEYNYVVSALHELQVYEYQMSAIQTQVIHEASQFVSAYMQFTCEDSLLYYEACSTSAASSAVAVA